MDIIAKYKISIGQRDRKERLWKFGNNIERNKYQTNVHTIASNTKKKKRTSHNET